MKQHKEDSYKKFIKHLETLNIPIKDKSKIVDNVADMLFELQDIMLQKNVQMESRITDIEKYLSDETNTFQYNANVKCPYCQKSLEVFMDREKMDYKCPYCHNELELEWENSSQRHY